MDDRFLISEEALDELYTTKVLFFMEEEAQTGIFMQIMLTKEQRREAQIALTNILGADPNEPRSDFYVTLNDEVVYKSLVVKDDYPIEEIESKNET